MTEPQFKCPDCGKIFENRRSLGPHRRMAHGYTKPTARKSRKKPGVAPRIAASSIERNRGAFPCPHCDFIGRWTGGLKLHMNAKHKVVQPERSTALVTTTPAVSEAKPARSRKERSNGHYEETFTGGGTVPEATLALAAGRVQELLSRIAFEFDVPPRTFAARVIELVHATALR